MTDAPSAEERAELLRRVWATLAAPLATEVGSIAAIVLSAYAGIGIGLLALVVFELVLPRVRPSEAVASAAILVAGPPLRYLLLLVAVIRVWIAADGGPIPALSLVLGLAFAIPLAAFLVAQTRAHARRDG
jgi:hypothetical protein